MLAESALCYQFGQNTVCDLGASESLQETVIFTCIVFKRVKGMFLGNGLYIKP